MYGERIKSLRQKRGMSQQHLAEHLGITAVSVSKWERGQTQPDITALKKMADLFGVTVDELIGHEPPASAEDNIHLMTRAFRQLTADEQEKYIAVGRALFAHAFPKEEPR